MTESTKNWKKILSSPWPLIGTWWVAGILSILIPLFVWRSEKQTFYSTYGQAIEYENEQRAYQEAQNANQQNQNDDGQELQSWNCGWWQFRCRNNRYTYMKAYGDNGNGERMGIYTPNWYNYLGGKYDDIASRDREALGMDSSVENSGALRFVYTWSVLVFLAVLAYGSYVFYKRQPLMTLNVMMGLVWQYALLLMIVMPQGIISTEERDLERNVYGWYGQMGVLMVYFSSAQLVFCPCMVFMTWIKFMLEKRFGEVKKDEEDDAMNYHPAVDKPYVGVSP
ncbi:hypothetical protein FisN_16Hh244 [Fistulifera solaris]|jgi:hypothetical protein|uniref:Uncharacterized protein n=1 Tax=Fistulifera solaris TaxID=1519565 RepID=A0A1Z5KTA6_FISSO|nr:hypothetical protein FisN_16Hh244 [Fistulifera solaris]|eukprot:GAX29322.1 hypothetical protein FisN_16Hh244 [Fistulifera solaris]